MGVADHANWLVDTDFACFLLISRSDLEIISWHPGIMISSASHPCTI